MTIHLFSDSHYVEANSEEYLRNQLGGKGFNLNLMTTQMKLPVPPGFTITTRESIRYLYAVTPSRAAAKLNEMTSSSVTVLNSIGNQVGRSFGDADNPLLVSVRSGARVSMPGMMDTILNLGLNDDTVQGLAKQANEAFAYDSYRRFLQMYGEIVLGVPSHAFEHIMAATRAFLVDEKIPVDVNKLLIEKFKQITNEYGGVPHDVTRQLKGAIEAVWNSWNSDRAIAYRKIEGIPHDWGTAVNIQAMVFGNMDDESGTGVVFSRDPNTGENITYGDFLVNAQGEDVVSGTHTTLPINAMKSTFPEVYKELLRHLDRMENYFEDMVDVEFTIESGKLWILQVRSGKRTTKAAIRIALDMMKDGIISSEKATNRIMEAVDKITKNTPTTSTNGDGLVLVGKGLPASDGVATGKAVFSAEEAISVSNNGTVPVILITHQTKPDDVPGMSASAGVLTLVGGKLSHAAVITRGWEKPCIVSLADATLDENGLHVGNKTIKAGDLVKINGETGEVFA